MLMQLGQGIFSTLFIGQIVAGIIYVVAGTPGQKSAGAMQIGYGLLNIIMVFVLPVIFKG